MRMCTLFNMLLQTSGKAGENRLKLSKLVEILENAVAGSTHQRVAVIASNVQPHLDGIFVENLTKITVVSCYQWVFTEDIAQHTLYEVPTNVDEPRGDAVRQIRLQLSSRTTMTAHWTNKHLIDMSQFQIVRHVLSDKVCFTTEIENAKQVQNTSTNTKK